ncbi:hypothetical protein RI103_36570 [Paraburkholderia sp. FT54]|uniref:hypothetical protein n=1 Tax=Paraburkholderia sp. FT54 TaxID=3074437 RepID=UPI002877D787|nr:hypothetical protein [Paraburkholderia sp. FT54]WNC94654.1 hypothetical protein RI103_36570 [Paraburkholderia sp. FT54]
MKARRVVFLFVERCMAGGKLAEVLEPLSNAECLHSIATVPRACSRNKRCRAR